MPLAQRALMDVDGQEGAELRRFAAKLREAGPLRILRVRPLGKGAPRYGNRPGMATFAQLELIRELWRELRDARECDDEALLGWLRQYHKVDSMRMPRHGGRAQAINAMTAWKARPRRAA